MDPLLFGTTHRADGYWKASTERWRGTVTVERSPDLAALTDTIGAPRKVTWTFDGGQGAPSMAAVIEIRQRSPELRSFTIAAAPEGRGLQAVDFRTIDVDVLIRNVLAPYVVEVRPAHGGYMHTDPDPAIAHDVVEQSRKRRRRLTPAMLEEVAQVYRQGMATGRPLLAIQAHWGVASNTAKSWVRKAREAGALPPTSQGKPRA